MSEVKFTPGPWLAQPPEGGRWYPWDVVAECEIGGFICQTSGNCEANARLIAAAPELLAALKNLLASHRCADETGYVDGVGFMDIDAIDKAAEAAIAKAEGGPVE